MDHFLAGCSKQSGPPAFGTITDSTTVTVVNGYGSGKYKVGDTVDVRSNTISSDSVFNEWTGDNNILNNAGGWHSSFIMPRSNITLTATCTSILQRLQQDDNSFSGSTMPVKDTV